MVEKFRWLAGVIAAHKDRCVVGRTRLHKTIKLLQRKGLPTDFRYALSHFGPYSEGLHADIGLLNHLGLVREKKKTAKDGTTYYILTGTEDAELPEVQRFQPYIDLMNNADAVVLELAATYDTYRELGSNHTEALERVRRKKESKCGGENLRHALALLRELELPTD